MPHTMVIFGASGDLTSRKLIPALYRLFQRKRCHPIHAFLAWLAASTPMKNGAICCAVVQSSF